MRHLPWPERFWAKVNKDGEGCWEWTAAKAGNNGYGTVFFEGRLIHAHRASWILAHGAIPSEMKVLHRCDNPLCVRPEHLFLGTQKENIDDCVSKGRYGDRIRYRGHKHALAKLSPFQVRELRALYGKCSYATLGKLFGISTRSAFRVVNRKSYKEVA